jgi:hypothetical protein
MREDVPVVWIVEFEGEDFDLKVFPDGQAFVVINSSSASQRQGRGENSLLSALFPPKKAPESLKFKPGDYPITILGPLLDKIRIAATIESREEQEAIRGPIDDAVLALFVTQVVPRMRVEDLG